MENNLQVFTNEEFGSVRIVTIDGEPWFIGKDVATALGYGIGKSLANAVASHVDTEDKGVTELMTPGGKQKFVIINESGLYSLVLSSKLPTAKQFKRWVTSEVLPSIRKHGGYIAGQEAVDGEELLARALLYINSKFEESKLVIAEQNKKIEAMRPAQIFADAVTASDDSILIRDLAKLLKQNGVDIGEKRLFAYLRDNEYLISRKGKSRNTPTQRAMNMGLFEITEHILNIPGGDTKIKLTTRVTGKGQRYFVDKFLDRKTTPEYMQMAMES